MKWSCFKDEEKKGFVARRRCSVWWKEKKAFVYTAVCWQHYAAGFLCSDLVNGNERGACSLWSDVLKVDLKFESPLDGNQLWMNNIITLKHIQSQIWWKSQLVHSFVWEILQSTALIAGVNFCDTMPTVLLTVFPLRFVYTAACPCMVPKHSYLPVPLPFFCLLPSLQCVTVCVFSSGRQADVWKHYDVQSCRLHMTQW